MIVSFDSRVESFSPPCRSTSVPGSRIYSHIWPVHIQNLSVFVQVLVQALSKESSVDQNLLVAYLISASTHVCDSNHIIWRWEASKPGVRFDPKCFTSDWLKIVTAVKALSQVSFTFSPEDKVQVGLNLVRIFQALVLEAF